jgi:hypothetical protein
VPLQSLTLLDDAWLSLATSYLLRVKNFTVQVDVAYWQVGWSSTKARAECCMQLEAQALKILNFTNIFGHRQLEWTILYAPHPGSLSFIIFYASGEYKQ